MFVCDLGSVQLPFEVSSGSMDDSEKVGLSPPTAWCPIAHRGDGFRVKLCQHQTDGGVRKGWDAPARDLTGNWVSDGPKFTCESSLANAGSMEAREGCFLIPPIRHANAQPSGRYLQAPNTSDRPRPVRTPARDVAAHALSLPSATLSLPKLPSAPGAARRGSPIVVSTTDAGIALRHRTRISRAPSGPPRLHSQGRLRPVSVCGRWRCGAAAARWMAIQDVNSVPADEGGGALLLETFPSLV